MAMMMAMIVSPILEGHPGVTSGVGDPAHDAVATGTVRAAVAGRLDPAHGP